MLVHSHRSKRFDFIRFFEHAKENNYQLSYSPKKMQFSDCKNDEQRNLIKSILRSYFFPTSINRISFFNETEKFQPLRKQRVNVCFIMMMMMMNTKNQKKWNPRLLAEQEKERELFIFTNFLFSICFALRKRDYKQNFLRYSFSCSPLFKEKKSGIGFQRKEKSFTLNISQHLFT